MCSGHSTSVGSQASLHKCQHFDGIMCVLQIKELEDSLLLAQQASADLQHQLDTATASGQSQASDLAAAQSRCTELSSGLEALQSQLAQAQADEAAATEALSAQQALTAGQEQQRALQVGA